MLQPGAGGQQGVGTAVGHPEVNDSGWQARWYGSSVCFFSLHLLFSEKPASLDNYYMNTYMET